MNGRQHASVRYTRVGRFFFFLLLCTAVQSACHREYQLHRISGQAQGSYYSVQYYAPAQCDLRPTIDSFLTAFDSEASLWVDNSLLRRLNANQTDSLSPILSDMLQKALYAHDLTNGAFDCRIGCIVQAWGFSFKQRCEPDSTAIDSLLHYAHGQVQVSNGHLLKQYPQTELDLNAIAQGYAADLLASLLSKRGITDYLINIGGEIIAHGHKAGRQPWCIGIEQPSADSLSLPEIHTSITLCDQALVTSGNYRKYYVKDGQRYSHTINPTTGYPAQHSLLSATVVEKDCWLADAMATAYMVMGLDSTRSFIEHHPDLPGTKAVMLIYDHHGQLQTYTTPTFETLITHIAP
ncbi:MAG: FAD:protein FMN transferase [Bacteroidales bacterium]|nr:FAD:protein FMN transferase [Bacteroidales bacterium]